MKRLIPVMASVVVGALLTPSLVATTQPTVVVVHGHTIVAFFPAMAAESNDPDTNEALADFQFYAEKMRKPLRDLGIDFQEVYALSFRVRRGKTTTTFRPGKVKVGYYFAAPDKEPLIEYGVITDTDLLQAAKEYFDLTTAPAELTSGYCLHAEQLRPNLDLSQNTRIRGNLTDETRAPLRNSPIELRRFVSESEQFTVSKVSTDGDGNFDFGVVKQGNYRLLLSPHHGFKQPAKLECWSNDCTLDTVLIVNPTDAPEAGCPVR